MIRTLLALDGALVRGSLAFVLGGQDDIDVVAELDGKEQIAPALCSMHPDVAVVDFDLFGAEGPPHCPAGTHRSPMLMLVDPRRSQALSRVLRTHVRAQTVGFLGNHVPPLRVVEGVRQLSRGEPVVDADLVVAALNKESPLTARETEVLQLAAEGLPVREMAIKLSLAPGTVRNHLSRILTKAAARTRIEAVRIAREAGWI
ncbi:two-component system, NarL family, response regulator DesR [Micromonospora pattaloongensis]|uniref:Two-component system, NarL family, response regulator DesR n=1 Tax=Micromonospora pattaloongensis TaxID=405436 RepID=A0A1H3NSW3_9ACTN|nr:response regulator transcription factor [Micromonospora pattaloongensis]SDY91888.1 two-component system, NarL family, response regulator DesR [Micromonospora pattaloongensis]